MSIQTKMSMDRSGILQTGKVVGQFGLRQLKKLPYFYFIMATKQERIADYVNNVIVIIVLELRNIKSIRNMLAVLGKKKCQRKEVNYARPGFETPWQRRA